jgi:hypothetical protein
MPAGNKVESKAEPEASLIYQELRTGSEKFAEVVCQPCLFELERQEHGRPSRIKAEIASLWLSIAQVFTVLRQKLAVETCLLPVGVLLNQSSPVCPYAGRFLFFLQKPHLSGLSIDGCSDKTIFSI